LLGAAAYAVNLLTQARVTQPWQTRSGSRLSKGTGYIYYSGTEKHGELCQKFTAIRQVVDSQPVQVEQISREVRQRNEPCPFSRTIFCIILENACRKKWLSKENRIMRKSVIDPATTHPEQRSEQEWFDLEHPAKVEVTSEDPNFPSAAQLLAWLASEENEHMTGQTIFIDGGADVVLRGDSTW
jgi:hypothetical protein